MLYDVPMHTFRIKELVAAWERTHGRRLHLKELAERTGIASYTLCRMMRPSGYVTNTRYVETLCRFFEVTPNDLMFFSPPLKQ